MLETNIRGRLELDLHKDSLEVQKQLSCVFVRHASEMLAEPNRTRVKQLVDVLKSFLVGKIDIHQV